MCLCKGPKNDAFLKASFLICRDCGVTFDIMSLRINLKIVTWSLLYLVFQEGASCRECITFVSWLDTRWRYRPHSVLSLLGHSFCNDAKNTEGGSRSSLKPGCLVE